MENQMICEWCKKEIVGYTDANIIALHPECWKSLFVMDKVDAGFLERLQVQHTRHNVNVKSCYCGYDRDVDSPEAIQNSLIVASLNRASICICEGCSQDPCLFPDTCTKHTRECTVHKRK